MTQTQPKKSLTQQDVKWIAFWLKADANEVKQQLKDEGYTIIEQQSNSEDNKP
ncbi:MAG: hypothetical protein WC365_09195 [Candidatus Babeliales bacterium]|jgi:hypothetical protein